MPKLEEQVEKLGGAVESMAKAHKELADKLKADIEARGDIGEWPAIKELLDQVGTNKAALDEVQQVVKAYDRLVKLTGGDDSDASPLVRMDSGYYAPNQGRMMPNPLAAKALAHFVHAVVSKKAPSLDFLEKVGIELVKVADDETRAGQIHDDELGGYALPPEFGGIIMAAMATYGVFAQHAEPEVMASNKKTFVADETDVQIYALEEGETIPEVDAQLAQRTLEAKLWGAFTRWSADFEEYGLVNVGETWAQRFARAIAKKQDECGFLGDGTSTYNNMVGLLNHADAGLVSLGAGDTAFTDVTYDDIIDLIASVPDEVYAEGNCRFFFSNNLVWLLAKIKDGDGRPMFADAREGVSRSILGEPYTPAAVFPRLSASAAGTKFMAYGDLRRAFKMGLRTQMVIAFSPHAYFRQGQNCLRVLSRWGIASAYANAVSVLKTADA